MNSSDTASRADVSDIVILGKIVGAYGVRGEVRVHPFADDPKVWAKLPSWWVGREGDAPALWQESKLIRCKLHVDTLIAELACVPDRSVAESMRGVFVGVPREVLPPAEEGEYYWADLVGLDVVNTKGQLLGCVLGLIETPANDVLRVGDGVGVERLLPFVDAVVLDVDVSARRVRVEWELDW